MLESTELIPQITQEQLSDWLQHPATKTYLSIMRTLDDEAVMACGSGGCFNREYPLDVMYSVVQLNRNFLHQLSDFEGMFYSYDAVEVEKDEKPN